jgi:hypothetical protein
LGSVGGGSVERAGDGLSEGNLCFLAEHDSCT